MQKIIKLHRNSDPAVFVEVQLHEINFMCVSFHICFTVAYSMQAMWSQLDAYLKMQDFYFYFATPKKLLGLIWTPLKNVSGYAPEYMAQIFI